MRRFWLFAVSFIFVVIACNNPATNLPPYPNLPFLSGIEISGPDTVAPGQSAQFFAVIRLSDGTRKNASPGTNVTWTSTSPLLRVTSTGLATAQQGLGDATLKATVPLSSGRGSIATGSKDIVILPEGTFRVAGIVN